MANSTRTEVHRYAELAIEQAHELDAAMRYGVGPDAAEDHGLELRADWVELLDAMALEVFGTKYTNRDGLVAVTVVTGTGGPHVEFTIDEAGRVVGKAYWGSDSAEVTDYLPDLFRPLAELVEVS